MGSRITVSPSRINKGTLPASLQVRLLLKIEDMSKAARTDNDEVRLASPGCREPGSARDCAQSGARLRTNETQPHHQRKLLGKGAPEETNREGRDATCKEKQSEETMQNHGVRAEV